MNGYAILWAGQENPSETILECVGVIQKGMGYTFYYGWHDSTSETWVIYWETLLRIDSVGCTLSRQGKCQKNFGELASAKICLRCAGSRKAHLGVFETLKDF